MIANTLGQRILDGSVERSNYAGPPILIFGPNLTTSDDRWLAAADFAAGFSAPLIGVAVTTTFDGPDEVVTGVESTAGLRAMLALHSRFHTSDLLRAFRTSPIASRSSEAACAGPILVVPHATATNSVLLATQQVVWDEAQNYRLAPANHRYGHGLSAIGPGDPEGGAFSPPIYYLLPANLTQSLTGLAKVWRAGGPSTSVAVSVLRDAATGANSYAGKARPGIDRRVMPALVGQGVLLARPPLASPPPDPPDPPPAPPESAWPEGGYLFATGEVTLPMNQDHVTFTLQHPAGTTEYSVSVDPATNEDGTRLDAIGAAYTSTQATLHASAIAQVATVFRYRAYR